MLLICTTEMYLQIMFQIILIFPGTSRLNYSFGWTIHTYVVFLFVATIMLLAGRILLLTYILQSYLSVSCNSCKGSVSIYSNCGISNVYMTFLCSCCLLWWKWGRMLAFTWMPWSRQVRGGIMSGGVSHNKEEGHCIWNATWSCLCYTYNGKIGG